MSSPNYSKNLREPVIWFDSTTIKRLANRPPVGLSRVEANVLRGAMKLSDAIVRFCYFDRYRSQLEELDRSTVLSLLGSYGSGQKSSRDGSSNTSHGAKRRSQNPCLRIGRVFEERLRKSVRRRFGSFPSWKLGRRQFQWQPGDTLVLSGGSWDSIDADVLKQLAEKYQVRLVMTIADMIPILYPHHFEQQSTVDSYCRYAATAASHASLVLHISESTKRDFDEFAKTRGIAQAESHVLHLGTDPVTPRSIAQEYPGELPNCLIGKKFVLSVGTIQVRKNHQLLYQLWRKFAEEGRNDIPVLVLVGSRGWMTNDLLDQMDRDPLTQDSICLLEHTDDAKLSWLYHHCEFTLYPSLYEGWGLPIVESLQHGKPCIASNTSSMPEAGQGLAIHLDPLDFAAWYRTIVEWTRDPESISKKSSHIRESFVARSWEEFGRDFCKRVSTLQLSPEQRSAA